MRRLGNQLPGMRRAKIALNALTIADEATRFANWFPMMSDDAKADLLSTKMSDYRSGAARVFAEQLATTDASAPLDRMLYCDSKLWLPDYLLLRGDKLTMANSLEARVPLLDHKLVEFAAGLPANMKLRGSNKKMAAQAGRDTTDPTLDHRPEKAGLPHSDRSVVARGGARDDARSTSRGFDPASRIVRCQDHRESDQFDTSPGTRTTRQNCGD